MLKDSEIKHFKIAYGYSVVYCAECYEKRIKDEKRILESILEKPHL